jgi:hypothetical protein
MIFNLGLVLSVARSSALWGPMIFKNRLRTCLVQKAGMARETTNARGPVREHTVTEQSDPQMKTDRRNVVARFQCPETRLFPNDSDRMIVEIY